MKPDLRAGITGEVSVQVTEDMCPAIDGAMIHPVYSTWSLAHHMEVAARRVLAPFLEPHEEALGTHLTVDHLAPTPVGKTVCVVATCIAVDHRRVICDVSAYESGRVIGRGKHFQRVLPKETVKSLIERHK